MRALDYIITTALCIWVAFLFFANAKLKSENEILQTNVGTLLTGAEQYKVKDSLQVATIENLELSISEYRRYKAEDKKLLESLKIDNNRLKGIIKTQTESFYEQTTLLRDSVKMLLSPDSVGIPVNIKAARFSDQWHSLNVIIQGDSINYKLKTKESLLITNHVVPKRFLFFKFGCREVRTEVVSKNPYVWDIQVESITIR
jgi:hypothetical protein